MVELPAPERWLREIHEAGVWVLGFHKLKELEVGRRDVLTHGGIDEVALEHGRGKKQEHET